MNKIGNLLLTVGILGLFGTAGASDLNDISFSQMLTQAAISLVVLALGVKAKNKAN